MTDVTVVGVVGTATFSAQVPTLPGDDITILALAGRMRFDLEYGTTTAGIWATVEPPAAEATLDAPTPVVSGGALVVGVVGEATFNAPNPVVGVGALVVGVAGEAIFDIQIPTIAITYAVINKFKIKAKRRIDTLDVGRD